MTKANRGPRVWVEAIFDVSYLLIALAAGVYLLVHGQNNRAVALYGVLSLVLAVGDSFHLIPRVVGLWRGDMARRTKSLGFGKLVTSITMTLFYVFLCYLWPIVRGISMPGLWLVLVWGLAGLRILLCLLPQNQWLRPNPPLQWAVLRNVPFLVLGAMVVGLYSTQGPGQPLPWLWLAVTLSFAFYLPVVLLSQKYPAVGALMLPKTCAYLWIIFMGFTLL